MELSLIGLALGAVVGLILALTGAGGGILAVPLLVFGLHLYHHAGRAGGLIAVGSAAAIGAVLGLREGLVRYRAAAVIGLIRMALAPVGVRLARVMPNGPLTVAFAVVLFYVATRMLMQAHRAVGGLDSEAARSSPPCVVNSVDGRLAWTMPCARVLATTGVVSGLLSGLLGVGGGFVIVPSLTSFTNLATRSILATSLAVIALVSIGGVAAAAAQGSINWDVALPFGIGAVAALLAGRRIAARVAGSRLQQGFAIVSGLVSVLLLARGMGWISA